MLRVDQIKAAIVANLKTRTDISNVLVANDSSIDEIRESQWKGDDFEYPAIRVRMLPVQPYGDAPNTCGNTVQFSASIMVFTESPSSYDADNICGIIANDTHGRSFNQSNIHISATITTVIPAVAVSKRVWRAECLIQGIASLE